MVVEKKLCDKRTGNLPAWNETPFMEIQNVAWRISLFFQNDCCLALPVMSFVSRMGGPIKQVKESNWSDVPYFSLASCRCFLYSSKFSIPVFGSHDECGNLMLGDELQNCKSNIMFVNNQHLCLDLNNIDERVYFLQKNGNIEGILIQHSPYSFASTSSRRS